MVKRIIGLEGDVVRTRKPYPYPTVKVPPGHVWVEGDNLAHSRDSRFFGPIPMALITGRTGYFRINTLQLSAESLHAGAGFRKVPVNEVEAALAPYDDG